MSFHGADITQASGSPIPSVFSSSGGAWIYPCSGAAYYSNLGKRSDVFSAFTRGTFPSATLPNFLHEATHHLCFDSVVGYVLLAARVAAQYGGGFRFSCKSATSEKACLKNISCCNRVAYSTGLALLQPLCEGLAMYGQCDALPGKSLAASALMFYTPRVYLEEQLLKGDLLALLIGDGLSVETARYIDTERGRVGSQFKSDMALLEKRDPRYKPYWHGYNLVRKLADVVNHDLDDTDVTLGFLCSYFFHDNGLAVELAKLGMTGIPPIFGIENSVKVARYLENRIDRLLTDRSWREEAVGEYVRALLSNKHPQDSCQYCWQVGAKPIIDNFTLNAGLEFSAKMVFPTVSHNRRNLKIGSFIADTIEVRSSDWHVRCRFDDVTIEVEGMKGGFPCDFDKPDFWKLDGSAVVEFVFLDQYEPAIALYNGHNLLALCDRSATSSKTSPEDESKYGRLSPAVAFWRDMQTRTSLWQPSEETPCVAYHKHRHQEALELGFRLCDI